MKTVRTVTRNHHKRVSTGEVNRFFEEVLAHHPPPTSGGRSVRLYYVTQARVAPPTFMISTNYPERVHTSLSALRHQPDPRALRLRRHADPRALPQQEQEGRGRLRES